MFKIRKHDNSSLDFIFDRVGLENAIEKIEESLNGNAQYFNIELDKNVFSKHEEGCYSTKLYFIIAKIEVDIADFIFERDKVISIMDQETADLLLYRFKKSLNDNDFAPSELFSTYSTIFKGGYGDIYCEMIK